MKCKELMVGDFCHKSERRFRQPPSPANEIAWLIKLIASALVILLIIVYVYTYMPYYL